MREPSAEPPPTPWSFPDVGQLPDLPDEGADDLVAVGADLEPGTVLAAYRAGLFPMPLGGRRDPIGWWSPARRGVLELGDLRVSRSLRRSCRDYEIRVDTAFDDVLAGCADPRRADGWIDDRIARAYRELHELGWAHSVEAWRADRLEGGLYGLAIGGLFAGESMFHRGRDASKAALVGLVGVLGADGDERRFVDVQWSTPHLSSLGVTELPRGAYLTRLRRALDAPAPRWRVPQSGPAGARRDLAGADGHDSPRGGKE